MSGLPIMSNAVLLEITQAIRYKNWELVLGFDGTRPFIQWVFTAPCSTTGEVKRWTCRKWHLSPFMVEGEIVQTAFAAALQAEEHECREFFTYCGVAPFNPHIKFSSLMEAAQQIEGRA